MKTLVKQTGSQGIKSGVEKGERIGTERINYYFLWLFILCHDHIDINPF